MGKPRVSVRKAQSVDEFVSGFPTASGQPSQAPAASGQPPVSSDAKVRGVVTRVKGDQRRRCTVYLSRDQGDQLERYCFEQRRQLSEVLAEAVAEWLASR